MFLFYPGFLNKRNNLEILLSKWFLVSIYAIYFPEHQLHTYHYNLDICIVHIYMYICMRSRFVANRNCYTFR